MVTVNAAKRSLGGLDADQLQLEDLAVVFPVYVQQARNQWQQQHRHPFHPRRHI